jgi:hypothetical protein
MLELHKGCRICLRLKTKCFSGTIYVLRSKSSLPIVTENRDVLHKIGVTSGKVERRIANAKLDPTFLMAEVEIVATYELYNINRSKLENLIHRIFDPVRLDIEIKDRFGKPLSAIRACCNIMAAAIRRRRIISRRCVERKRRKQSRGR